jgi:hypothetical protein
MRITNSKGMEIIAGVSAVDTPHDTDCPVWFVNTDGTITIGVWRSGWFDDFGNEDFQRVDVIIDAEDIIAVHN